ncbi:GAP family protein [Mycolicibacterium pallens]|uniref:GAP family protein n=1 Tax=Mycolicibacterium pallens TaxID=370524 RepID=A0ABX8VNK4_9MYCO|nr:GAP family protein [Mycolicibacterium pallens]QYL19404.1 GAP family protein [Mycolicibacterium pallens]
MWMAVLLLGVAVNFEPTRIGLIALMLTQQRPIQKLFTFVCTAFAMTAGIGLLVLFVFHHGFFGSTHVNGAKLQIGFGAVVLLLAAILASNAPLGWLPRPRAVDSGANGHDTAPQARPAPTVAGRVATKVRSILNGKSHVLSGAAGAALALPSVEYMALLALIIASNQPAIVQAAALFAYVMLANMVAMIPLLTYLVAPDMTRTQVARFNGWIRNRRRRDVAVLLATIGGILLGVGIYNL